MSEARYAVGIDLGTTHCVMAAVDLAAEEQDGAVQWTVPVPQLTAPGAVEERPVLPSFLYLPHPDELKPDDRILPWGEPQPFVVGELARTMGSRTPIRLVASAKSWLCHPGVDRRAAILPVEAPEEVRRVSPLQASIRYLEHLRAAWDHQFPDTPLADQEVILTVPASFDPAARELTAEAAAAVGLSHLVLLEEPQAALYHWILAAQGEWRKQVQVGDIILVIDLGGGTADFSLIAVTERDGSLELERVAVGDHILLGGDNMDLALAHAVRAKLAAQGTQLDPWQLQGITHGCRSAKETLLNDAAADAVPVVVPSRGSKLIGGTLRTELTRAEVTQNLVDGFFPAVDAAARPASRARAALTKLGLPYAQDPAMTRHLAAFLARQVGATRDLAGFEDRLPADATFLHPTAVLFNGGVFKAQPLLERTLKVLNDWLAAEDAPPVRLLEGADLDLAVARGAAYYGFVRRGRGVRIRGGTAKSYYVGVESAMPAVPGMEPPIEALCIAPFGMEEGTQAELPPQEVGLVIGEPCLLYTSDAADERSSVDLGGRRIIKKKKKDH
ncbi:MAG TPA: nucleotide-binding protein, partial [Candidatus Competibacteraceae bacterium]|nr:nucleotide-binding protein [Candidatus Competibacteraceae bacterium]